MKDIRPSNKTLTTADKASNMFCLNKQKYSNLLQNAIISKSKKTDKHAAKNINKEWIKQAREAKFIGRIDQLQYY